MASSSTAPPRGVPPVSWPASDAEPVVHSPLVGPGTWRPVAEHSGPTVPDLTAAVTEPPPRFAALADAVVTAVGDAPDGVALAIHSGADPLAPSIVDRAPCPERAVVLVDATLPHPGRVRVATRPLNCVTSSADRPDRTGGCRPGTSGSRRRRTGRPPDRFHDLAAVRRPAVEAEGLAQRAARVVARATRRAPSAVAHFSNSAIRSAPSCRRSRPSLSAISSTQATGPFAKKAWCVKLRR